MLLRELGSGTHDHGDLACDLLLADWNSNRPGFRRGLAGTGRALPSHARSLIRRAGLSNTLSAQSALQSIR